MVKCKYLKGAKKRDGLVMVKIKGTSLNVFESVCELASRCLSIYDKEQVQFGYSKDFDKQIRSFIENILKKEVMMIKCVSLNRIPFCSCCKFYMVEYGYCKLYKKEVEMDADACKDFYCKKRKMKRIKGRK